GTVEFIVDGERNFYFLEMNTRLQVEHPVTELITGIDLVEQMIRVAAGERLSITQDDVRLTGWAMESRLYAEDPYRGFLPSIGRLTRYRPPAETAAAIEHGILTHATPGIDQDAGIVRNDTGVFEGGEISKFYDPMIAKLCSWGSDRSRAIEVMRGALDAFEVEGIGHNLPFVATVMDHEKFCAGDMTTAFIAEEFPDGFAGADLAEEDSRRIAAFAAHIHTLHTRRDARVSGRLRPPPGRHADTALVVDLGPARYDVALSETDLAAGVGAHAIRALVRGGGGVEELDYGLHYTPGARTAHVSGQIHATGDFDAAPSGTLPRYLMKVDRLTEGVRIRYRGADLQVKVRTPRAAELAALMPVKEAADTSKLLLCPMPGTVVSIAVAEGEAVQEGQALCTVEAMKMENVLRAERAGTVSKINVAAGAGLSVDDVIMEFD
ncbi:MAG: biotin/lipoyl-containing protein, partial [Pseudomonadota bacterium]